MAAHTYLIDPARSSIGIEVRQLLVARVRGCFTRWEGALLLDELVPARSSVAIRIDAASIDTGLPARDLHLRSAEFLDVARFPEITFRSRRIHNRGVHCLTMSGGLTLRGVTREVVLDVDWRDLMSDPGGQRARFAARTSIDRSDFGITWNQRSPGGALLVDERVAIAIELSAVRASGVARAA
jgi:polyisoprenoid-binding protein YceI